MSILNVNQIQPVGSGQTVTISAANLDITGNLKGVTSSGISTFSDTVNVGAGKSIRLYGASSGYTEIVAAAGSASTTFTLPANGGSASQYLQTNGAGVLSWQTVATGIIPYFATEMVSNVAITHNTETEFTAYTTEVADTGSAFASGRFTPQTAGKYLIIAQASPQYDQKSISSSIVLRKNGSTKLAEAKHRITGNTSHYSHALAVVVDMNGSSDYVSLFLYQYNYTDSLSINFDFNIIQGFRLGD